LKQAPILPNALYTNRLYIAFLFVINYPNSIIKDNFLYFIILQEIIYKNVDKWWISGG